MVALQAIRPSRIVAVTLAATPLSLVLLLRIFRNKREVLLNHGAFRGFLKSYNSITRHNSGTRLSTLGLLTHVGRRSGRSYRTSLGVTRYRDGFLLPLTYGPRTDWYRNLMAAGTGTLVWRGQTYQLERPEIVAGPEALRSWPTGSRIALQMAGVHDSVWLHL